MPGARMNSPLANRSRSARAFTLLFMVDPLARQVDRAGAAAAVLLRPSPGDGTVFVVRNHRARGENTSLAARRMNTRHGHLRTVDLDGERLVARRAGSGARPHPGPHPAGHVHLNVH